MGLATPAVRSRFRSHHVQVTEHGLVQIASSRTKRRGVASTRYIGQCFTTWVTSRVYSHQGWHTFAQHATTAELQQTKTSDSLNPWCYHPSSNSNHQAFENSKKNRVLGKTTQTFDFLRSEFPNNHLKSTPDHLVFNRNATAATDMTANYNMLRLSCYVEIYKTHIRAIHDQKSNRLMHCNKRSCFSSTWDRMLESR